MTAAPGAGPPALRLEGLTRREPGREDAIVEDLTLDVPAGAVVALTGPVGCGKSTALRMVNRLAEPTSGRVLLAGEDVAGIAPDRLRRRIGYLPPGVGLFPHMTVGRNVAVTPGLLGWPAERVAARVDEVLTLVGLDPAADRDRYPRDLSPERASRAGIARALAAEPPVVLLDEPFARLDRGERDALRADLRRALAARRTTALLAVGDPGEAAAAADRVAVLRAGRLVRYDESVAAAPPASGPAAAAPPAASEAPAAPSGDSAIGRLGATRVGDVVPAERIVAPADGDPHPVRDALRRSGGRPVLLVDGGGRPVRWVRARDLDAGGESGEPPALVDEDATLQRALEAMLTASAGAVVVVDAAGAYRGVLDFDAVAAAVRPAGGGPGAPAARRGGRRRRRRGGGTAG